VKREHGPGVKRCLFYVIKRELDILQVLPVPVNTGLSGLISSLSATGCQKLRSSLPPGVSGAASVRRRLSSFESMFFLRAFAAKRIEEH
jgi:hypothetical protein